MNDRFVSFLYILMRDHLPISMVDKIAAEAIGSDDTLYTNDGLDRCAVEIAGRLAPAAEKTSGETFVQWGKKVINGERFLDLRMGPVEKVPPDKKAPPSEPPQNTVKVGDRFEWIGAEGAWRKGDIGRVTTGSDRPRWALYNETQQEDFGDGWSPEEPTCWRALPDVPKARARCAAREVGQRYRALTTWYDYADRGIRQGDIVEVSAKQGKYCLLRNVTKNVAMAGRWALYEEEWSPVPVDPTSSTS